MGIARAVEFGLPVLRKILPSVLRGVGLFAFVVMLLIGALVLLTREPPRDLHWIVNYLGISVPVDARDVQYIVSQEPYNFHLYLTFRAPPESANRFADHFCYGILHSGYDPLHAINTSVPTPDSI